MIMICINKALTWPLDYFMFNVLYDSVVWLTDISDKHPHTNGLNGKKKCTTQFG